MASSNQSLIDINQADEATLKQLHGIGSRQARQIIAARPFESIDDLTRVKGISSKKLKRWRALLTIAEPEPVTAPDLERVASPEEMVVDYPGATEIEVPADSKTGANLEPEISETLESPAEIFAEAEKIGDEPDLMAEPGPVVEPAATTEEAFTPILSTPQEPEPEPLPAELELEPDLETSAPQPLPPLPAKQPTYITRGGAWALSLFGCFFTLILAIAITLGIISSLNRGQLIYASPGQVASLQTQVDSLTLQSAGLASDLEGLRNRVDNLEALSGRVTALENEMEALQTELAATQAQSDQLATQIESLHTEVETIKDQTSRFESFLTSLRDLLSGLFPEAQE